jgi:hypothetical protein
MDNPVVPFPEWFKNGLVVGKTPQTEDYMAVGIKEGFYSDFPYALRLSPVTKQWVIIRPATKSDLELYDLIFLKQMRIKACYIG